MYAVIKGGGAVGSNGLSSSLHVAGANPGSVVKDRASA